MVYGIEAGRFRAVHFPYALEISAHQACVAHSAGKPRQVKAASGDIFAQGYQSAQLRLHIPQIMRVSPVARSGRPARHPRTGDIKDKQRHTEEAFPYLGPFHIGIAWKKTYLSQ
jgi:hypothetical protein